MVRGTQRCVCSGTRTTTPPGRSLSRRAIQLGLRGQVLEAYGQRELLEVIDLSAFVAEQRDRLRAEGTAALEIPRELVYVPADPAVAARVGLEAGCVIRHP